MRSTPNQRKSFVITSLIYSLLLLVLCFSYLKVTPQEPEGGIAVNFGTSKKGSGKKQPKKALKKTAKKKTVAKKTVKKKVVKKTPVVPKKPIVTKPVKSVPKKILTQNRVDAPVISKPKKVSKPVITKPVKKVVKKPVSKPKVIQKKPELKPDRSTMDIFEQLAGGSNASGSETQGQGNSDVYGDQGSQSGTRASKAYYGTGKGLDGDGNYRLGGRKALNKEKNVQECNEFGIVVVRIEVDQNGNVIRATPGVKGTTNKAKCLMDPAKRSALETKFNADANAPAKQVGEISYNFRVSK